MAIEGCCMVPKSNTKGCLLDGDPYDACKVPEIALSRRRIRR